MRTASLLAASIFLASATLAEAQSSIKLDSRGDHLIDEYVAYVGPNDLYNSSGQRLTKAWQVIRQDRANFYRFGVRDPGDQPDSFFASPENRERMEAMLANGRISPAAARAVVEGNVWVRVQIYGRSGIGRSVHVTVQR